MLRPSPIYRDWRCRLDFRVSSTRHRAGNGDSDSVSSFRSLSQAGQLDLESALCRRAGAEAGAARPRCLGTALEVPDFDGGGAPWGRRAPARLPRGWRMRAPAKARRRRWRAAARTGPAFCAADSGPSADPNPARDRSRGGFAGGMGGLGDGRRGAAAEPASRMSCRAVSEARGCLCEARGYGKSSVAAL